MLNIYIIVNGCPKEDDIKKSSIIVHSALVALRQLCNHIISGKITMNKVSVYQKDHMERLKAFCDAATQSRMQLCPDYRKVSDAVKLCVLKFNYVAECCEKLAVVMDYCKSLSTSKYI